MTPEKCLLFFSLILHFDSSLFQFIILIAGSLLVGTNYLYNLFTSIVGHFFEWNKNWQSVRSRINIFWSDPFCIAPYHSHLSRTSAVLSDDFDFPDVTFFLTIQRKPLYFIINIILPCAVLAFLSPLTFLMPAQSGERSGLAITLLLSMVVFMLLVCILFQTTSLFLFALL